MNQSQKILIAIGAIAVLGAADNAEGLGRARRLSEGHAAKKVAARVEQAPAQPAQAPRQNLLLIGFENWGYSASEIANFRVQLTRLLTPENVCIRVNNYGGVSLTGSYRISPNSHIKIGAIQLTSGHPTEANTLIIQPR